jgi:hypothetical protein
MDLGWINNPWLVAVNVLAAFRITRLVVADAFPFGPLRLRISDWANERWAPLHAPLEAQGGGKYARALMAYDGTAPLAYLVTCPWCVGLYVTVVVGLLASTGTWWMYPAAVLATSAAIGLLATLTD